VFILLTALPLILAASPSYQYNQGEPLEAVPEELRPTSPADRNAPPLPDPGDDNAESVQAHAYAEAGRLDTRLSNAYPDKYAGLWFAKDKRLKVAFVESDTIHKLDFQRLVADRSVIDMIDVVNARLSLSSLNQVKNALESRLIGQKEIPWTMVYVDERQNRVVLGLRDVGTAIDAALREEFGPVLAIVEHEGFRTTDCTRTNCVDEPLRGGLEIFGNISDGFATFCTSGFSANRGGVQGIFTAGHCTPSNQRMAHYVYYFGVAQTSHFVDGSRADAVWIEKYASWQPNQRWVYRSESNKRYVISSVGNGGSEGAPMCFTGKTTNGTVCAGVIDSSVTVEYPGGVTLFDQALMAACARAGDSGGPVYYAGVAHGLVSGISIDQNGNCTGQTVYSKIRNVENATGAQTKIFS
jgi:hypothetical protein